MLIIFVQLNFLSYRLRTFFFVTIHGPMAAHSNDSGRYSRESLFAKTFDGNLLIDKACQMVSAA